MKHETGIVGSSFPGQITIREGYSEFFNGLMDIVRGASEGRNGVDGQTGESLRSYVMDWLGKHPLQDFNEYSDTKYIRSYIGRCPETHWEAIVMSWKRGNTTTIHGHPQFAASSHSGIPKTSTTTSTASPASATPATASTSIRMTHSKVGCTRKYSN